MPFYENVFIARQDISAAQVEALADQFTAARRRARRQGHQARILGPAQPRLPHQEEPQGPLRLFNLDAPPAAVNELERNMRINEDVLRYLTVRVDELEPGPRR